MTRTGILRKITLVVGLISLILSAILLTWRLVPGGRDMQTLTIPAGRLPAGPPNLDLRIDQDIQIGLHWPKQLKAGEAGQVKLRILPGELTHESAYVDPYQKTLSGELVMIGIQSDPQGLIRTAYQDIRNVELAWQISTSQAGDYPGKVWVMLEFMDGQGTNTEIPLAVFAFQTEVTRLWGMDAHTATWMGLLGLLVWGGMMALSVRLEHSSG